MQKSSYNLWSWPFSTLWRILDVPKNFFLSCALALSSKVHTATNSTKSMPQLICIAHTPSPQNPTPTWEENTLLSLMQTFSTSRPISWSYLNIWWIYGNNYSLKRGFQNGICQIDVVTVEHERLLGSWMWNKFTASRRGNDFIEKLGTSDKTRVHYSP